MTSEQQRSENQDSKDTETVNKTLLPENIPKGWDIVEIQDLLERVSNRVEPDKMDSQNYVSLKHMGKSEPRISEFGDASEVSSKKYKFSSGSILFGKLRPYFRKVALTRTDGICSTDINVVEPTSAVERDFLFYTLFRQDFIDIADKTSTGTRMPRADWKKLDEMEVALPPLSEQKKISRLLYQIDTKIELNVQSSKIMEEMAQNLFNSWFVDFEPYEQFKDSNLGRIPKDFVIVEFSDICRTEGGGTPNTDEDTFWGGDILWLTPKEVAPLSSSVAFDTERKLSEKGLKSSSSKVMPKNSTLLYSRGANMGVSVINKEPMATNQGFVCIEPIEVPPHFMFHLVSANRPKIENRAGGSTYPEISQTSFNEIEIALPESIDIVEDFEDKVSPIYKEIHNLVIENVNLERLRDTLLPSLMSGNIRVNELNLDRLEVDIEV